MTQQALADAMGWASLGYVARIEAGSENVGLDTVERLARTLGVEPGALFAPPTTDKPGPGRPKRQRPPSAQGG